jgi:hypothetical protein
MMEKSAQPGEGGGGARSPLPFTVKTTASKVERADTLPLFLLYPYMYSVGDSVASYAQQLYVVNCLLGLRILCFLFIFDDIYTSDYEKVYV